VIERYLDHAANERTCLAWIRTGITIMVLCFVVDEGEFCLASTSCLLSLQTHQPAKVYGPECISLALVLLGVLVIVIGSVRFFRLRAH